MDIFPSIDEIIEIAECASTNDEAFQALHRFSSCLIWTQKQTGGRGSRGRQWLSPEGHALSLSIGLQGDKILPPQDFNYPLFTGVLLYDTLSGLVDTSDFRLKWPNDLLYQGRKIAGILCESRWHKSDLQLVLGIGLNLRPHPDFETLPKGFASLAEIDGVPSPARIVAALAAELPAALVRLHETETLNRQWMKRCIHPFGTGLKVKAFGQEYAGVFKGLAKEGCMLIESGDGAVHRIQQSCDDFQILR